MKAQQISWKNVVFSASNNNRPPCPLFKAQEWCKDEKRLALRGNARVHFSPSPYGETSKPQCVFSVLSCLPEVCINQHLLIYIILDNSIYCQPYLQTYVINIYCWCVYWILSTIQTYVCVLQIFSDLTQLTHTLRMNWNQDLCSRRMPFGRPPYHASMLRRMRFAMHRSCPKIQRDGEVGPSHGCHGPWPVIFNGG